MAVTSPFTAFKNGKKEIHLGQHVLAEFFECDPKVSYEFLKKKFNSKKATFSELKRGIIDEETLKVAEKPFEIMQQFAD